jgi:hypothetical protein
VELVIPVLVVLGEQVERPHEHVAVMVTPAQFLEDRQTIPIARHGLAVDNTGLHRQRVDRFGDQRITRGEIVFL